MNFFIQRKRRRGKTVQVIEASRTEPVIYWGGKYVPQSEFEVALLGTKEDKKSSLSIFKM
jgi:hypothetical protein